MHVAIYPLALLNAPISTDIHGLKCVASKCTWCKACQLKHIQQSCNHVMVLFTLYKTWLLATASWNCSGFLESAQGRFTTVNNSKGGETGSIYVFSGNWRKFAPFWCVVGIATQKKTKNPARFNVIICINKKCKIIFGAAKPTTRHWGEPLWSVGNRNIIYTLLSVQWDKH